MAKTQIETVKEITCIINGKHKFVGTTHIERVFSQDNFHQVEVKNDLFPFGDEEIKTIELQTKEGERIFFIDYSLLPMPMILNGKRKHQFHFKTLVQSIFG